MRQPGLLSKLEPVHFGPLERAQVDVERLRHLLWNGHHEAACEALGRIASRGDCREIGGASPRGYLQARFPGEAETAWPGS